MRALSIVSLGFLSLAATACYEHHTADEQVSELSPVELDAGVDDAGSKADAAVKKDGGATDCSKLQGIEAITCSLGGGNIEDIIGGLLGGGGSTTNCSKQTDEFAKLLCNLSGGTGIEGLLGGLLGGGGGGDAGINGVIQGAITDVLAGIVDDLISGLVGDLFGGLGGGRDGGTATRRDGGLGFPTFPRTDGGLSFPFPRRDAGAATGNKGVSIEDDGTRSEEECANAAPEDLLTRLLCARQAIEVLRAQQQ